MLQWNDARKKKRTDFRLREMHTIHREISLCVCVCHVCVLGEGGGVHAPGGGIAEPDVATLGLSRGGVTGVTGTAWWCCRTKT